MNTSSKVKGKVKWWDDVKGFGFLVCDGYPTDVFVHKQQLNLSGIAKLQEGDTVSCVINQGPRGHFATTLSKD